MCRRHSEPEYMPPHISPSGHLRPRPPRPTRRKSPNGLALLETAVAVCLLTLLAVIGYPRIARHAEAKELQLDLDSVLRTVRWARRQAMTSGQCVRLCLPDAAGGCLGPAGRLELSPCEDGSPPQVFQLHGGTVLWKGFRRGIALEFDARGLIAAVTGSLYLCNPETQQQAGRILINRSGRIRSQPVAKGACPLL